MEPTKEPNEQPPAPAPAEKTTAPAEMRGLSPREAARLGIWSGQSPIDGQRYRPPYSLT